MADLTEGEIDWIREWVGDKPDDAELKAVFAEEGIGTREGVVRRVLNKRLANLLANPAQFSVPGDYSQNTSTNIEELKKRLDQLDAIGVTDDGSGTGSDTLSVVVPDLPIR